jgi:hypothetical protein
VFVAVLVAVAILVPSIPAWAEDWMFGPEAWTFGLTPDHHRVRHLYEAPTLWWAGKKMYNRQEGTSFSQPLIVFGSRVGLSNEDAALTSSHG